MHRILALALLSLALTACGDGSQGMNDDIWCKADYVLPTGETVPLDTPVMGGCEDLESSDRNASGNR